MRVWSRGAMGILLLLSMGLAACTGTGAGLSGTAGDLDTGGDPAAVVAGDEGEDDAAGAADPEQEDHAVGEAGGEGESDDVGEGDADEALEADEAAPVGTEGGEEEGAEDDAVGEGAGEGEDDAVAEAGDDGAPQLPPAPVANAQAALAALEPVRFDTLSWREIGDLVDRRDMTALRAYFMRLSDADVGVADCPSCLDTVNVLLGEQPARVDDVRALLEAIAGG